MKYKVLLTGNNASVIDIFFTQLGNSFEALTTSVRYEDIIRHVNVFEPDAFIYCIHNEARENMSQMTNVKYKLAQDNIPVVIIGSKEECDEFERIAVNVSELALYRPLSAEVIGERVLSLLDKRSAAMAAAKRKENGSSQGNAHAEAAGAPFAAGQANTLSPWGQPGMPSFGQEEKTSQRKHILVIDDNSMMLRLVKEHLHEKYDVATALSGKIALKFLKNKKTDLILLDYEMPDENGPAVLEKLRASDATKDIPVVFLTGVTESKKIKEALLMKPQSYLLKPINRDRLLDTIEKLIG